LKTARWIMSTNMLFVLNAKSLGEYLIISKVKLIRSKENLVTNLTFNHYFFVIISWMFEWD
jgi:hypothetical protein